MTKIILPTLIFQQILSPWEELHQIKNYGADGVEIRRERLKGEPSQEFLNEFSEKIEEVGLNTVIYSVPSDLYSVDGKINSELEKFAAEATAIKADALKLSLGNFSVDASKKMLEKTIKGFSCSLLLENSQQILPGGTMQCFVKFFQWAENLPVAMTFDVGNWVTTNEDVNEAYRLLNKYIAYVHIKNVREENGKFISVPVNFENSWLRIVRYHKLAAIEFPLQNADREAPIWIKHLKEGSVL